MRKLALLLNAILILFLAACGNSGSQTEDISTDNPPEQQTTETASPVSTGLSDTDAVQAQSTESVVYYYFFESDGSDLPTGSVVVLPDILILAPTESGITCVADPAVNIRSALHAMIDDPLNEWTSDDLAVIDVALDEGHATVALQGGISGPGDIVLIAFRMQILMTVFAETSVQTAAVTLNGECIGNLGISHDSEARPADYVYVRADIEAF